MKDFSNYNFITDSIFITDNNGCICFVNYAFKENFGDISYDINKLIPLFDFDVCILDNAKILEVNPIMLAINSNENYSCRVVNVQTGTPCELFKIKENDLSLYIIRPINPDISIFDEKIKELEDKNKKVEQLKQKAQTQAAKITLLNRIYTITQKENDTENILKYTFDELKNIFGAEKLFFAQKNDDFFEITNIFPSSYEYAKNEKFQYEAALNSVYGTAGYIKDFDFFKNSEMINHIRISIPVHDKKELFGLLFFSLPQKNFSLIDEDFLNSLCSQLASAILQSILLEQLKENQLQLINSEKLATLGNMIAAVAHEINTPLGSINSNNEILSKMVEKFSAIEKDNKKIVELMNSALKCDKEAIKRIMSIVTALKKFVRLDEAKTQLTDVSSELNLTLDLCQHLIKNRITVIKDYGNIPQIYTHPNMLNQVFMNLITNAAQSIKGKGEIVVKTYCAGENAVISIKDNGEGIKEEIKSKIFQQGFTTKPKETGSGLGLSISKKIIEQLGGTISFTSQEGNGAEFLVSLPYKENNL